MPPRLLYIYGKEDAPLRQALEDQLAVLARAGTIEGWGSDWLLPGDLIEAEVERRLAAADVLVPLVSPALFASDGDYALLTRALRRHREEGTPLVPVLVRPVAWDASPLAGLCALPHNGRPVTSWAKVDEAWFDVVQGLREVLGKPGRAGAGREDPLRERAAQVEAAIAGLLAPRPRVAEKLVEEINRQLDKSPNKKNAEKRKIAATGDTLVRVLPQALVRDFSASVVVAAANLVDAELTRGGGDGADRGAIRQLLFQLLPIAVDWRRWVEQGWPGAGPLGAARAVELPLASATVAEIVVSGIDERSCRFTECSGSEMPVGVAAIRVPAAARAPFFDVDGKILVEAVVLRIAAAMGVERADTYSARLRDRVDAYLAHYADEAAQEDRLPYYLLLEEDDLGEGATGQSAWILSRSRLEAALPSLRLVRLHGGSVTMETGLALQLRDLLKRKL